MDTCVVIGSWGGHSGKLHIGNMCQYLKVKGLKMDSNNIGFWAFFLL